MTLKNLDMIKRLLFKAFPVLGEEMPAEWLEPDNIVNRLAELCMLVGIVLGAITGSAITFIILHK